jgi:hypothetical protein
VIRRATPVGKNDASAKKAIRRDAEVEGHSDKKAIKKGPVVKKEAETQGHKVIKKGPVVKKEADTQGHVLMKAPAKRSNDPDTRVH